MEIFEVTKARLGLDSKRFTTVLVACFVALPVSLMVLMMYQGSMFDLFGGGLAKAKVLEEQPENLTDLALGSKYNSSQLTRTPDDKLLHRGFGDESSPSNGSSQPNGIVGDELLNRTLSPGFGEESGLRNDSSQPNDRLINQTLDPGLGEVSGQRNDSQPTNSPDDKLLSRPSAPRFGEESGPTNIASQPHETTTDKFLDGLLASGFDEKSCSSRYQSFLYRKASPYKPSSHLLAKLRKYEDLHRRCGPYSKSYSRALKALSSNKEISGGCKYVVWTAANGLGNRMISITSAFLFSLLTNRVLLLDYGPDMADLFCEPFPSSSWHMSKLFPLRRHFGDTDMRHTHSVGNILKNGNVTAAMESPPSYLFLSLNHGKYNLDEHYFYCDKSQDLLQKIPWLILLSDQYFSPAFFLIPSLKKEVSKLFPERESIFHHLSRYLFHPSNQVWGLITRFYDAYLAKADQRVGLQIRVYYPKTPHQTIMDQILSCTQNEKILPVVDAQNFVASRGRSIDRKSKAVLITSLYPDFYENISTMYWTKPTVTGEVMGVYQPSHEEYQHFGNNAHNVKALADIYLLSLSDVLVTSAWSTFGYVAQGLGGLKPWILSMTNGKNIPNPPCKRDISIDPCFHFPLTYDCKAKIEVDAGALVPYIRHCMDFGSGVKLVGDHEKF